jgi:hypothetical protein
MNDDANGSMDTFQVLEKISPNLQVLKKKVQITSF